jgi:hypothetical protein
VFFVSLFDYKKIKVMRDYDKEYKEWKADMLTFLICGLVLGFIVGILLT